MIQSIKGLNDSLWDMMVGIFIFSIICECSGIWFVQGKAAYSFGILIGFLLAEVSVWQMANSIDKAMYMEEHGATKIVRSHSIIRYTMTVLIFVVIMVTKIANPFATFASLMGIKVAAYLQPVTHKILNKKSRVNDNAAKRKQK